MYELKLKDERFLPSCSSVLMLKYFLTDVFNQRARYKKKQDVVEDKSDEEEEEDDDGIT